MGSCVPAVGADDGLVTWRRHGSLSRSTAHAAPSDLVWVTILRC